MIVLFISLIFYVVDPMLGIIMAVALPSIIALDSTGEYGHALVGVIFGFALYFVRKVGFDNSED